MKLLDLLEVYRIHKPDLDPKSLEQMRIACRLLAMHTGCDSTETLSEETLLSLVHRLIAMHRSPRTINGRVGHLLTLWRWSHRRKLTKTPPPSDWEPLSVPRRIPRAWNPEEMARIVAACDSAPRRRTWTGRHWKALILTIYDTSLRIGCLLAVPRSCLAGNLLVIPAELQKGGAETAQRLHEQTVAAIESLPNRDRLFDWPYHPRDIWTRFRSDVLAPAGLPVGRRDLFHKIRRTSYTHVYGRLSPRDATAHAAHTSDLSGAYLDPILLAQIAPRSEAVGVLPRPGQSPVHHQHPKTDRLAELVRSLNEADRQTLASIAERLVG